MIGLDARSKTNILYKLKLLSDTVQTTSTIDSNMETVEYKIINITIWYVGGQPKLRPLWTNYCRIHKD